MSSKPYSILSEEDRAEMLASKNNPEWEGINKLGAPCGRNATENFYMMLDILSFCERVRPWPPDLSLPVVKSFIL